MKWLVLLALQRLPVWTSLPRQVLEATGLFGMIGKADRGPAAIEAIKDNQATYFDGCWWCCVSRV